MDTHRPRTYNARARATKYAANNIGAPMSADYTALRRTMVERQVRTFDVTDQEVIARMLAVPRERFLPEAFATLAYSDSTLDLPCSDGAPPRRLLAPLILGRMLQASRVSPGDRVLDVGGATGYSAALLAGLARSVVALESDAAFAEKARSALAASGMSNVEVIEGALTGPVAGTFELIFINGAVEANLEGLLGALSPGGRLVTIFRVDGSVSRAVRFDKDDRSEIGRRSLFDATSPTLPGFAKAPAFVF
ncbi:MAG: protein-L-isoaspartate O-methyltransferase [Beijerinckiaceae bacterium]